MTAIGAVAPVRTRHPVLEVMSERSYRNYWISVFLSSLIFGGARFTWVWLVIKSPSQAALVGGIALGLPHLLFGIPAGVWADRVDRRRLVCWASLAMAVVLALSAWLEHTDRMDLAVACATAAALGTLIAVVQPTQTAMVPELVPAARYTAPVSTFLFAWSATPAL